MQQRGRCVARNSADRVRAGGVADDGRDELLRRGARVAARLAGDGERANGEPARADARAARHGYKVRAVLRAVAAVARAGAVGAVGARPEGGVVRDVRVVAHEEVAVAEVAKGRQREGHICLRARRVDVVVVAGRVGEVEAHAVWQLREDIVLAHGEPHEVGREEGRREAAGGVDRHGDVARVDAVESARRHEEVVDARARVAEELVVRRRRQRAVDRRVEVDVAGHGAQRDGDGLRHVRDGHVVVVRRIGRQRALRGLALLQLRAALQ